MSTWTLLACGAVIVVAALLRARGQTRPDLLFDRRSAKARRELRERMSQPPLTKGPRSKDGEPGDRLP
jgi:ABC-type transport system involved in cytochrome bd biosynthesis fused ATPase/permease subunit